MADEARIADVLDALIRFAEGDFSGRVERTGEGDNWDVLGYVVNQLGSELSELWEDAQRKVQLESAVEQIAEGLTRIARLELDEPPMKRSYDGDALDLLAYMINQTGDEVRLLTQDLEETRAELVRAKKMQAVATMAGGIAHTFNNSLTAIISYAELVEDALPLEHPLRADVGEILKAARNSAQVVAHIHGLSSKKVKVMAPTRIDQQIDRLRPALDERLGSTIRLDVQTNAETSPAAINPWDIEQTLISLLTNAKEAMPEGGRVSLELRNWSHSSDPTPPGLQMDKDYLALVVTDDGPGMSAEVLARCFDPFFTTKGLAQHGGMGLAITQGIIEAIGGRITAESVHGKGSRFTLYVPKAAT